MRTFGTARAAALLLAGAGLSACGLAAGAPDNAAEAMDANNVVVDANDVEAIVVNDAWAPQMDNAVAMPDMSMDAMNEAGFAYDRPMPDLQAQPEPSEPFDPPGAQRGEGPIVPPPPPPPPPR